jgi:hypothetical protein
MLMQTVNAKKKFSIYDYCQYLLASQINYTITNLADHLQSWSHDTIRNFLKGERITARVLWDKVKNLLELDEDAFVIFDDTVVDKNFSFNIETVKYQYSGNEHEVIKGIGIVNCVYVNPKSGKFWIIDYRIYNPDADGKTKIDHLKDMMNNLVHHKKLPFKTVLMDTWYASVGVMMLIDSLKKIFYCPIKKDRHANDTETWGNYKRVDELGWSKEELQKGKVVKLKKFPGSKKVKLFRITVNKQTEFIATNELTQNSSDVAKENREIRWKVEEFHRELKQVTGVENCQCRKNRLQRNHIGCAMLVWTKLKLVAYETKRSIYQVKFGLLQDYLKNQLKNPSIQFALS